jgi:phosphoribosylformylglycinamidine synthase
MTPRALILRAPGTNCDEETVHAFELAGAAAERVHVNRLLEHPALVREFQILCIPGGFSYGDDVAAGRIFAQRLAQLGDVLREFHEAKRIVLGICNGFQVLMKTGLLLPQEDGGPRATLAWNASGRFEDRWVTLAVTSTKCPLLAGVEELELPVAHAEGRFVTESENALDALEANGQLVLRYVARHNGTSRSNDIVAAEVGYPDNPNGSSRNVAGICDATGRVFGLMPHPERFFTATQHPQWTRRHRSGESGDGLRLFQNAVAFFE